jgi:hypothetical protein
MTDHREHSSVDRLHPDHHKSQAKKTPRIFRYAAFSTAS